MENFWSKLMYDAYKNNFFLTVGMFGVLYKNSYKTTYGYVYSWLLF